MKNILLSKRAPALFLSCFLCFGLTSCQETPEETLVAQKNQERLASAAAETAGEENNLKAVKAAAPETYTYRFGTERDSLQIIADAPVTLPETDSLSAYRISSGYLPQKMVTEVYDYLFQNRKTYTTTGTDFTKEECQNYILQLKQELAEVQAADEINDEEKKSIIEQIRSAIKDYEDSYNNLPDRSTLKTMEADSTLIKNDFSDAGIEDEYYVNCYADDDSTFSASSNSADKSAGSLILYHRGSTDVRYSSSGDDIPVSEEQARSQMADSVGISFEDARKLADGLFQAAGVNARLVQTYLKLGFTEEGDNRNPWLDESEITHEKKYSAFRFLYTRVIDQAEAAYTSMGMYLDAESDKSSFSSRWHYETMEVLVSKNGIESVRWDSPITLDEKISDNVKLMSFDDAAAVFEKMAPTIYQGRLESQTTNSRHPIYKVTVNSVKLCLMRVRDNGSRRTGLLVPAWVFYGEWYSKQASETEDGNLVDDVPYVILAVNAVDGTVIDPMEGY